MINIAIGTQDNRNALKSQHQSKKQRADELWQCVMYDRLRQYALLKYGCSGMSGLAYEIMGYDAGDER